MSFFCPHCDTENGAGHTWTGMKIRCPACLREIILAYRNGQSIGPTGWEVTFADFCRLIDDNYNSQVTHPRIAQLLDCIIVPMEGRFVLRQQTGTLLPLEAAHFLIQSDPDKQRSLYDLAMDVWR